MRDETQMTLSQTVETLVESWRLFIAPYFGATTGEPYHRRHQTLYFPISSDVRPVGCKPPAAGPSLELRAVGSPPGDEIDHQVAADRNIWVKVQRCRVSHTIPP